MDLGVGYIDRGRAMRAWVHVFAMQLPVEIHFSSSSLR